MEDAILSLMNEYGYLAVVFLIALENVFPPIPSEIILTFGGFLTTYTEMEIPFVVLAATAGALLGAFILYGVGRLLSEERLMRLFDTKALRFMGFKPDDITMALGWFDRHGKATVFFCRFIPIIRSLISIPAGTARMPFIPFALLTALGSAIWNTVLVLLGAAAGSAWERVSGYADMYSKVGAIILVIVFLVAVYIFFKKRIAPRIERHHIESEEDKDI